MSSDSIPTGYLGDGYFLKKNKAMKEKKEEEEEEEEEEEDRWRGLQQTGIV